MAKRTIQVDDKDIEAADKAISDRIDQEVRKSLEGTPMDPQTKALLEAADKKLEAAAKESAGLTKRLEALEACATDAKKLTEAEQKAEDEETLRRATFLAEQRGVPKDRREAEAKRLAGMGRAAVDEILRATPAPRADPLRLTQRREAAPKRAEHVVRRLESHPDGSGDTLVLTVQDWSHYDSSLKADGTPDRGHPRPAAGGAA